MGNQVLPGSDKYRISAAQREPIKKTPAMKLIDRANAVSIFDVLEDFFDIAHPRSGGSFKGYCPFRWEHADGGLDKGWRTYPTTNSSHCFPMHGMLTPVRLVQLKFDLRATRAAERILDNYGLLRPKSWRERYGRLVIEREQKERAAGNPQHAVEALSLALKAVPGYESRQFDSDVIRGMEIVLERLDEAVQSDDPEAVRKWYRKAKQGMARVITEGRTGR